MITQPLRGGLAAAPPVSEPSDGGRAPCAAAARCPTAWSPATDVSVPRSSSNRSVAAVRGTTLRSRIAEPRRVRYGPAPQPGDRVSSAAPYLGSGGQTGSDSAKPVVALGHAARVSSTGGETWMVVALRQTPSSNGWHPTVEQRRSEGNRNRRRTSLDAVRVIAELRFSRDPRGGRLGQSRPVLTLQQSVPR